MSTLQTTHTQPLGCWASWGHDTSPVLFLTEIEALRHAVESGYRKVIFVKWGEEVPS